MPVITYPSFELLEAGSDREWSLFSDPALLCLICEEHGRDPGEVEQELADNRVTRVGPYFLRAYKVGA